MAGPESEGVEWGRMQGGDVEKEGAQRGGAWVECCSSIVDVSRRASEPQSWEAGVEKGRGKK